MEGHGAVLLQEGPPQGPRQGPSHLHYYNIPFPTHNPASTDPSTLLPYSSPRPAPPPNPPLLCPQTLILKSPAHTARLKLLHELFPQARFVHISRNPYEIYQSTKKLFRDLLIQVTSPSNKSLPI